MVLEELLNSLFRSGTNWLALEITVSVLSGLAFCEYVLIGFIVGLALSVGKERTTQLMAPRTNNNNNDQQQKKTGHDGPYNAFNEPQQVSPAAVQQQPQAYDDGMNPRFKYHLQQLSVQQMAQEQMTSRPASVDQQRPASGGYVQQQSSFEAPQRGRLQVLHNQRVRPAVPPKPANTNYYRT